MRNMSFALTTNQVMVRTKTVTRRLGWAKLQPGTLIQPVVKGMGLKKGETVQKIGGPVRVVRVTRERLDAIASSPEECAREGFPELTWTQFVVMFCNHNRCQQWDIVTRIEFDYVEVPHA